MVKYKNILPSGGGRIQRVKRTETDSETDKEFFEKYHTAEGTGGRTLTQSFSSYATLSKLWVLHPQVSDL